MTIDIRHKTKTASIFSRSEHAYQAKNSK